MLEFIALGKPVVTHLWLESCGEANCLISEKSYILRDAKKEREIGFSMPVSLDCAKQCPLLKVMCKLFLVLNLSQLFLSSALGQSCVMLLGCSYLLVFGAL